MKKICLLAVFAVVLLFPAAGALAAPGNGAADMPGKMSQQAIDARLKMMEGAWFDGNNRLVLEIYGRKINDWEVLDYEDLANGPSMGTTIFWVMDNDKVRGIQMDWRLAGETSDYLFIDGTTALHRR
ncbi:hypothetical protein QCO44_11060 [Selenomonas sputigena]|uniref:Uncharacterized protein n=1 Tax=Selenomonas sputigena TaxID=69823 RepID=A0ABV3X8K9_9FIRM